jgi:hypothetical protein
MATTLALVGSISGVASGATPAPTALNATTFGSAPAVALTAGTAVQFNFVNNGALVVVVFNTAAAGGCTWEPTLYPNTSGVPSAAILGLPLPLTSMIETTPSTIGAYILGPFGPSKFNDTNGLCWIQQVTASAATSYIGLFSVPGSLT